MASIYGRETYAIDSKGRVSIPASMRRDSETRKAYARFFLKAGSEGCLQLYPPEVWATTEAHFRKLMKRDADARAFVRGSLQDSCWVTVDAQGRVTIPPALLHRAGLSKEAVLSGVIDLIEIWSPERERVTAVGEQDLRAKEFKYMNEDLP